MENKMVNITQIGDPVLRECAQAVPLSDVKTDKIKKIMNDMTSVLATQKDGIAIAAPQIGVPLRIFIVSDAVLSEADPEHRSVGKDLVFINPKIIKLSREKQEIEEGCLSIRWKYGKVKRSIKATIKGYNELGEKIERGASGLLAQVFQHEVEHLDGMLFTDKAKDIQDIPPEEHEEKLNNQNHKNA